MVHLTFGYVRNGLTLERGLEPTDDLTQRMIMKLQPSIRLTSFNPILKRHLSDAADLINAGEGVTLSYKDVAVRILSKGKLRYFAIEKGGLAFLSVYKEVAPKVLQHVMVWKNDRTAPAREILEGVMFDVVMAEYDVLHTSTSHTERGKLAWTRRILLALERGWSAYVVHKTREGDFLENIDSPADLERLTPVLWTTDDLGASVGSAISKHPLETKK